MITEPHFKVEWNGGDYAGWPTDCHVLLERDEFGHFTRVVACDAGEPEDQTLGRNYSWVAEKLNVLASECASARARCERLERAMRRVIRVVEENRSPPFDELETEGMFVELDGIARSALALDAAPSEAAALGGK